MRRLFLLVDSRTNSDWLEWLFVAFHSDVHCGHCGRNRSGFHRHRTKQCYTCACGHTHVYPRTGTLLEGSRVPLRSWMLALQQLHTDGTPLSVRQLMALIDVSYVTAWSMSKTLRGIADPSSPWPASFEDFLHRVLPVPVLAR